MQAARGAAFEEQDDGTFHEIVSGLIDEEFLKKFVKIVQSDPNVRKQFTGFVIQKDVLKVREMAKQKQEEALKDQ
jgi:hypothetical protein